MAAPGDLVLYGPWREVGHRGQMAVASGEEDLDVVDGLTAAEAADRLRRDGPNALPVPRRTPAWRRLAAQMVHFFALLFWVAGVLAFVAGLPQLGVAIFFVVVLNGVFAFVQEERAEHAAERSARPVAPPGDGRSRRPARRDPG